MSIQRIAAVLLLFSVATGIASVQGTEMPYNTFYDIRGIFL